MAVIGAIGFFAAVFLFSGNVCAIENYCSMNTFNTNETFMQLTKEATYEEFAIVGTFKGLHCCAKGYRSIEWYKDGKLYPWPQDISRFIIFPESANQTIYTQKVTKKDAGNYTCRFRNDTVIHEHTIYLEVFDELPDDPKITYFSHDQEVAVGENLRLFCEAFAGKVDLPDARNEAVWRRSSPNGTVYDVHGHLQQKKIHREDGQTFGTYLIFPGIRKEDFGNYICIISKPGTTITRMVSVREKVQVVEYVNPNPFPVTEMIFFTSAVLFILMTICVLYIQYGLRVQVRLKDSFSPLEENDGKSNDVLIVYSPKDSEIALGVLLAMMENHYNYKCASRELAPNISNWYSDLQNAAKKSRRIIAVISPASLNEEWEPSIIHQALKQLQALGPKLTCVVLKELPINQNEVKNSQGETLTSLARSTNIILWKRSNEEKFWLTLRLRLPPKRRTENLENKSTQGKIENDTRLSSDSEESLNNLV